MLNQSPILDTDYYCKPHVDFPWEVRESILKRWGRPLVVGLFVPTKDCGVSWYRGLGPWNELSIETGGKLKVIVIKNLKWSTLQGIDVAVLNHFHGAPAYNVVSTLKSAGIPIIGDW